MALPKKHRLTKDKDIKLVFSRGRSVKGPLFFIKFIENNLDCARIAVIISKKVSPKAVTRNLIKRRIHEALRTGQKNFLKKNFDVTVTAIPAIVGKDLKEINSNFDQTTKQIL
ncbi:MAG: ribonuclease P protein component [Candidatus Yanofskybacteria bacterium RIFCSPHIGHO2_02_FULL_41_11]|uniref:Ribonuclease P protein component n=1 Tax=Candidatus Yanofskybacteria bacterium RIFCSPHIGHO2_02_FULL_41_11 TaxID=1802675 RepID=A0A1F8F9C4_9BACT|nr:MAG: ribonuclease P protein component [Candidatus Yanofskybacteria bacterium RIFCSPHIGHO2_02_FULL_41_11]